MDNRQGQFVVHRHTTPGGVHWDLMLDGGQVLWTWRIGVPPEQIGCRPVSAEQIADHPMRFLTYEGPVQNKTGQVQIADSGEMILQTAGEDSFDLELKGKILSGSFELIRQTQNHWILRRAACRQEP